MRVADVVANMMPLIDLVLLVLYYFQSTETIISVVLVGRVDALLLIERLLFVLSLDEWFCCISAIVVGSLRLVKVLWSKEKKNAKPVFSVTPSA